MKSAKDRDRITKQTQALGFEMESVGIWEVFPCVVIKSVSDYADSHKSKAWQPYAAAYAASYAKGFLRYWDSARR
jgi:nucleoside phosphorylase